MSGAALNQVSHMRVEYLSFRACSDAHRDKYHKECPNCIAYGTDVACSDPLHTDKDAHINCPTCSLILSKLEGITTQEEKRILKHIFKGKEKTL